MAAPKVSFIRRFHCIAYCTQVSAVGLLSFEGIVHNSISCGTSHPFIAPFWAYFVWGRGHTYYRTVNDSASLEQVMKMITNVNPELSQYQPTLAIVVTWTEAQQPRRVSLVMLKTVRHPESLYPEGNLCTS